ncbi:GAF and ANTAR domain-containing protein [Jiangella gansuensis]|uniref:GAF and ANTAR domain-containing protein n=1 Tax=Jiangella gansuensis TaxID=281473 RepID=UPI0004B15E47|nr:GAF and ANTAR domain-containing protein [Jiangella gansuensis]
MALSLSSGLAALAADLHRERDVERTCHGILRHAQALTGGDGAAMIIKRGRRTEVVSSSPVAEQADLVQLEHREGPGLSAMSQPCPVVVHDLTAEARWQRWRERAVEMGLQSSLSFRIGTTTSAIGALNVYATRARAFATDAESVARLYTQHASVALAAARHESGLRRAIDARQVIGQAQGILMERHALDAEAAFTMLRNSAQERKTTLSERARQIVATSRASD